MAANTTVFQIFVGQDLVDACPKTAAAPGHIFLKRPSDFLMFEVVVSPRKKAQDSFMKNNLALKAVYKYL